jgi:pimeloyl-ACP methyl ester carboxylesterase
LRTFHQGTSGKLIIFIHGLWGDPLASFATNSSVSWLDLMKDDRESRQGGAALATYSTATLQFPAGPEGNLSIPQIVAFLRTDMLLAGVHKDYREIYFIAHSLGGLVIKELLLSTRTEDEKILHDRTKAIFLIATPASGSEAVKLFPQLLRALGGRLTVDLRPIMENAYLEGLQDRWDNFLGAHPRGRRPAVFCAYETKPIYGYLVVSRQFTEPFCDGQKQPFVEDHISIVKPSSRNARMYAWVRDRLGDPQPPPDRAYAITIPEDGVTVDPEVQVQISYSDPRKHHYLVVTYDGNDTIQLQGSAGSVQVNAKGVGHGGVHVGDSDTKCGRNFQIWAFATDSALLAETIAVPKDVIQTQRVTVHRRC